MNPLFIFIGLIVVGGDFQDGWVAGNLGLWGNLGDLDLDLTDGWVN